jgi:Mg-chelatase subunit ChlD
MTLKDYNPNGFTALYDSVRVGVDYADIDKKIDERVIVVIMTDGQENSSRNTNSPQIRQMITEREARGDWTFIYIGEDVENWVRNSGMSRSNAAQFSDRSATQNFHLTGESISQFRSSDERNSDHLIENSVTQGL